MNNLPDYCEIRIHQIDYFVVDLPVTAFGYQDSMIMTLSVDYGKSKDEKQYLANIWASQKGANVKHLIYRTKVPICEHPDEAIAEALNADPVFHDHMCNYIKEAAKHRI